MVTMRTGHGIANRTLGTHRDAAALKPTSGMREAIFWRGVPESIT